MFTHIYNISILSRAKPGYLLCQSLSTIWIASGFRASEEICPDPSASISSKRALIFLARAGNLGRHGQRRAPQKRLHGEKSQSVGHTWALNRCEFTTEQVKTPEILQINPTGYACNICNACMHWRIYALKSSCIHTIQRNSELPHGALAMAIIWFTSTYLFDESSECNCTAMQHGETQCGVA